MFGAGTRKLFERLPSLHEFNTAEARRMLSAAFLDVQALTLQGLRLDGPDERSLLGYLRRLANALESYAIFDRAQPDEVSRAAAFVAAESLTLLGARYDLSVSQSLPIDGGYRLAAPGCFAVVEAALLYLYAGFDANAVSALARIPTSAAKATTTESLNAEWALEALMALVRLDTRRIPPLPESVPVGMFARSPREAVRAQLMQELGRASIDYLGWLAAGGNIAPTNVTERLGRITDRLRSGMALEDADTSGDLHILSVTTEHADIHHLARLLSATIESTKERALRTIPPPVAGGSAYSEYLRRRTVGINSTPRPLVWPNAMRFISECLPGPIKHSVVNVPTGAGKSFLAELAASQAIFEGWVLYLVPTNALANQVATDMKTALRAFPDVSVRLFFGGQEYTTAHGERVSSAQVGTVAVMTPEKCALALRLSPDVFHNCRLCIFDECHLISEPGRGPLAELVLSHLLTLAPKCSVMLMSAMMANPEVLAHWLRSATGSEVALISDPWRPTRTLRAVVAVDESRTQESKEKAAVDGQAAEAKRKKPLKRPKRYPYRVFHLAVANLQGAWTSEEATEYAMMRLPTSIVGKTTVSGRSETKSWVNGTAAQLAAHFVSNNQRVLTFLAASKHHCFTVAQQTTVAPQQGRLTPVSQHVRSLLHIAGMELGCESEPATLIERGVAVHTSALLDSERRAAEVAFGEGSVQALFATGTLAQGLNLPAQIVIVGGTSIGGQKSGEESQNEAHVKAQLLNAVGRAGRAGVASHGLAVVIPDRPISVEAISKAPSIRRAVPFLSEEDGSSLIVSRLLSLSALRSDESDLLETASADELVAISYLAARQDGDSTAEAILGKSLAFSRWPSAERSEVVRRSAQVLGRLEQRFLAQAGVPPWLSSACAKSGLPFLLMLRLYQALQRAPAIALLPQAETTLDQWVDALFDVLVMLPPYRAIELLGKEQSSGAIKYIWKFKPEMDDPSWEPNKKWKTAWQAAKKATLAYMEGKPLVEVANLLAGTSLKLNSGRNAPAAPIPRTIAFINQTVERLARAAGGVLALLEAQRMEDGGGNIAPAAGEELNLLVLLPLAIRAGCNSLSALAWYRFGIHLRRPAHLLAELFPLEPGVSGDSLVESWVRAKRAEWLEQDEDGRLARDQEELALLQASRSILIG